MLISTTSPKVFKFDDSMGRLAFNTEKPSRSRPNLFSSYSSSVFIRTALSATCSRAPHGHFYAVLIQKFGFQPNIAQLGRFCMQIDNPMCWLSTFVLIFFQFPRQQHAHHETESQTVKIHLGCLRV